jgi:hypothetical protein
MANARNNIKAQPSEHPGNLVQQGENAALLERTGLTHGEWIEASIEKAGADLMRMTPLERMNRRYPEMRLRPLPEKRRKLLGEPDLDICLQYYHRFLAADQDEGDEPVSILLEFLKKHPIEFDCSGWVATAVGNIVLGYPFPRRCEPRARKLFSRYWRETNSPKHHKAVQAGYRMSEACEELDSLHAAHWRSLVKWMDKAAKRSHSETKWFEEYAASRPRRCPCLDERQFQILRKAKEKIAHRYLETPPPSSVVLEAVAAAHGVSSRALAEFRADARKRAGKSQ